MHISLIRHPNRIFVRFNFFLLHTQQIIQSRSLIIHNDFNDIHITILRCVEPLLELNDVKKYFRSNYYIKYTV